MTIEELSQRLYEKHGDKYGIMSPPMSDAEALDILIEHFLGEYISVNPIGREQYNTEVVAEIIRSYKGKKENSRLLRGMFGRK